MKKKVYSPTSTPSSSDDNCPSYNIKVSSKINSTFNLNNDEPADELLQTPVEHNTRSPLLNVQVLSRNDHINKEQLLQTPTKRNNGWSPISPSKKVYSRNKSTYNLTVEDLLETPQKKAMFGYLHHLPKK